MSLQHRTQRSLLPSILGAFLAMARIAAADLEADIEAFDRMLRQEHFDADLLKLDPAPGAGGTESEKRPSRESASATESPLQFGRSARVTQDGREEMIATTARETPDIVPLVKQYYSEEWFNRLDDSFARYGFSGNHLGDALTELLIIGCEVVHNDFGELPAEGVRRVRDRVARFLLRTGIAASLSDAEKQAMAEHFKYTAIFSGGAYKGALAQKNAKLARQLQDQFKALARRMGIDLERLRLTEQGFEPNP